MSPIACRLCGQPETAVCLELERVPRNIQCLLRRDQLPTDRPVRLTVQRCGRCGFVQLPPMLGNEYYDDYLMTVSHSEQMQAYQREQAAHFVSRFELSGKHVKEIGCGDGNYLVHLRNAGANVSGVEPSETFRRLAMQRGFRIDGGYVTAARRLEDGPYDAFVTRQVLEHVPDIHDFLLGIRANLKPGAHGLVEVPSLEKAIEDRRFYDFFPDHVNYFSSRTLRIALETNGFEVLETSFGMFGEYNVAIVRWPEGSGMEAVQRSVDLLASEIESFVAEHKDRGQSVAIWGAGGKGLSIMSAADVSKVDFLIDGDPHKQGLFSPVSHLKVQSPGIFRTERIGAVVITAMAYHREIVRTLREDLDFAGTIALVRETLEPVQ